MLVQECWAFFKTEIFKAQEQAVPMCWKMSQQGRKPAWLNREFWRELRREKIKAKAEFTEVLTFRGKARLCQRTPRMSWGYAERKLEEPKPSLEVYLATAIKENKKCFCRYISNKRRALHPLLVAEVNIVTKDEGKAKVLTALFASVLTVRLLWVPRSRIESSLGTQFLSWEHLDFCTSIG